MGEALDMNKCYIASRSGPYGTVGEYQSHVPNVGKYKGVDRPHCQRCGQWLDGKGWVKA